MFVYNIRRSKYADHLSASGVANRWNKQDEFVIYAGQSISLATLEMVAHRDSIFLSGKYKLLSIELIVEAKDITIIEESDLPNRWKSLTFFGELQKMGSEWYQSKKSLVLQVPSVLVPRERNYLIHTKHPDFTDKVRMIASEDFFWDDRLL